MDETWGRRRCRAPGWGPQVSLPDCRARASRLAALSSSRVAPLRAPPPPCQPGADDPLRRSSAPLPGPLSRDHPTRPPVFLEIRAKPCGTDCAAGPGVLCSGIGSHVVSGGRVEPVRRSCSTHSSPVAARRPPRLSAGRSVAAVTAVVVGSLLAPSAGNAAPAARPALDVSAAQLLGADSHVALARLEARAGRLSRQYRGQRVKLREAETAAEAATARALSLRRQFSRAHRHIARLAAASYMDGGADPALALLFSGDPQRVLDGNATVEYLARQRSAREQELQRLLVAGARAGQTARHKVAEMRRLIANLVSQRRTVERLMA